MEKDIVGKWKVYNAEFVDGHLSQRDEAGYVEAIKTVQYDFFEDGSVSYEDDHISERKGKWSLNRDVISIEYDAYERYYGTKYVSYGQSSYLKIMSTSYGKMSLKETFGSGVSIIYYLEYVD